VAAWALATLAIVVAVTSGLRVAPRAYDAAESVPITAPEIAGPDRTPIARPSTRDGRLTFFAANPETGQYERFTPSERIGPARLPDAEQSALSPNGRLLAFVSAREGSDDIWVKDLATGAERRITFDPASDREPRWEDDAHIVFSTDRGRGLAYTTLYRIAL
jgi:Tol biopolymer transport system component